MSDAPIGKKHPKDDKSPEATKRPTDPTPPQEAVNAVGVDLNDTEASKSPTMPHERDERVGVTGGAPSERIEQAHEDLERGLKDTSRSTEADDTYRKLKGG